jgi:hypothetical protein
MSLGEIVNMITSNSQPINANSIWDKVGIPCRGIALHAAINSGFSYRIFSTIAEFMGMENKELASSHVLGRRKRPPIC